MADLIGPGDMTNTTFGVGDLQSIGHSLTCHHCGEPFIGRQASSKYCSQPCKNRAYNAKRKADGRLKAYREQAADQRKTWMVENRSRYQNERHCEVCETAFTTIRYRPTRFCSAECSAWDQRERGGNNTCSLPDTHPVLSSRIPSRHPARRPPLSPLRQRWYSGQCLRCGAWFIHDQPSTKACSKRCLKRLGHDMRRARQRAAFVEPVYRHRVFERDNWTCQVCELPVDRTASVPDPLAPTIDHIIPLARGGTHEPANAQCAHFICNSMKNDQLSYVHPVVIMG